MSLSRIVEIWNMSQCSLKIYEASILKTYEEDIDSKITPINKGFVKGKSCNTCIKELYEKIQTMKKGY